jgi:MFS family permease
MPIALLALTAGAFGIGTTEFVIMGLLMQVSTDLHVSITAAGLLISGYALGVAVGAPVLTIATRKLPRKTVLLALMAIFTLGNLACALAPNYELLMAARVSPRWRTAPSSASARWWPPASWRPNAAPRPSRSCSPASPPPRCSACRPAHGSACSSAGARPSGR